MSLSDEGSQMSKSFLKSVGRYGLKYITDFMKQIMSKSKRNIYQKIEKHNYSSVRKLVRKNKSAGITLSDFYEPDKAKYIAKELKRHNQDFSLERRDDGKIRVVTTSNNKELLNVFEDNFEKSKTQQKREPLHKRLFKAAERAKKENELNKGRDLNVVKHKEIGAR